MEWPGVWDGFGEEGVCKQVMAGLAEHGGGGVVSDGGLVEVQGVGVKGGDHGMQRCM